MFRHFDAGDPCDGVEDYFAKVVHGPVVVPVSAGEADAASLVFGVATPHDIDATAEEGCAVLVPQAAVVVDLAGFYLRAGEAVEFVLAAFVLLGEAHVEVEFVVGEDRSVDAVANGVAGLECEVGVPVGVDGIAGFEKSAGPWAEVSVADVGLWVDAVVDEHDAGSCFDLLVEGRVAFGFEASSAVGVEHDGVHVVEFRRVFRPYVDDFGVDVKAALVEGLGQDEGSRTVLVHAGSVARASGEEEDILCWCVVFSE